MTMNHELDRTITYNSNNSKGLGFLDAQKKQFNLARDAGIVKEIPITSAEVNAINPLGNISPEEIIKRVSIISVGEIVKKWRQNKRLSVTKLASQAHITKGYVSALETGKIKNPSIQRLEQLATPLGINAFDIYIRKLPEDIVPSNTNNATK
jgi:DNA-binding Xre family transcriptional regulator